MKRYFVAVLFAVASVASAACTSRTPAAKTCRAPRAVQANLTSNALISNGHTFPELVGAALNTASLERGNIHDALQEIGAQTTMRYLVECALPDTATVGLTLDAGGSITYNGAIGLAPEWATGPCNEDCQEWVSACLTARVNLWGMPYAIYMTGNNPALQGGMPGDGDIYPLQEGSFYGNYFKDPLEAFVCVGKDFDPFAMTIRACTRDPRCGFRRMGACGTVDGFAGRTSDRRACDREVDGIFIDCHSERSDPATGQFPPGSETYHALTIYLRDAKFTDEDPNGGC